MPQPVNPIVDCLDLDAKSNRMKYTVKASVMCLATTSLTTRPHITYQGRTILPD